MDKYEKMLKKADEKYHYSELEKQKMIEFLNYCYATDVRVSDKGMYEVFFKCDTFPNCELTTDLCNSNCARYYKCIEYSIAEIVESLVNQEKTILDFEFFNEFYFRDEVKSILKRYHGDKKDKLSDKEIDMIIKEIRQELVCMNESLETR